MAAGPIGPLWALGSWSDTAWEAFTWAQQVPPQPDTGVSRHTPPRIRPPIPPVRARIRWVVGPMDTALEIQVTAPTVTASVDSEVWFTPSVHLEMAIQAPSVSATVRTLVISPSSKGAITGIQRPTAAKTVRATIHSTLPMPVLRGTVRIR